MPHGICDRTLLAEKQTTLTDDGVASPRNTCPIRLLTREDSPKAEEQVTPLGRA